MRLPLLTLALAVALSASPAAADDDAVGTTALEIPAETDGLRLDEGEGSVAADEIRVRAESYEHEPGVTKALGDVEIRLSGMKVLADQATVFEQELPDGTLRHRFVAEGRVAFLRGEERLSGDRLEMDDTGHGFFHNAVGYVEPGVFVEARRIERLDADRYRVTGGTFSSCSQSNPRWNFTATRATIDLDDKITARNTVFKVKGVPVLYMPLLYYPIRKDGRSTGFLLPDIGWDGAKGFKTSIGFFWAMSRSADQTFSLDRYSEAGYGLGHELRVLGRSPTRARLRSYVFRLRQGLTEPEAQPSEGQGSASLTQGAEAETGLDAGQNHPRAGTGVSPNTLAYDLDWNAVHVFPGKLRATLNVNQNSNLVFLQQYQDDFDRATNRTERWRGTLERNLGFAVLSAYADNTDTYYGTSYRRIIAHLPGVRLRLPRPISRGGILLGLEGSADRLRKGDLDRVDTWTRYDLASNLSRPLRVSFLTLNPSLGYRYTRYGTRVAVDEQGWPTSDENGDPVLVDAPLDRSFFESRVTMTGPTFERIFDTPGFGYSQRFKHTIGPEITWTYRTRVEDFGAIPRFDGLDSSFLGTNEFRWALAQRFFAKRRQGTGKPSAYEFLSWRLMQTYYVRINEGQANYDPNYSSSFYGPGGTSEHLGPVFSRLRLRPTQDVSLDSTLEYDVNFKQIRRVSVNANITRPGFMLRGNWSRSLSQNVDPAQRQVVGDTLRGRTAFDLVPQRLSFEGSADYNLLYHTLYRMRAQLRLSVQCCGFTVEHIRYNYAGRTEPQWRFSLELANVGSIGNFMGTDFAAARQGFGGYR